MATVNWLIEAAAKHLVDTRQARSREHAITMLLREAALLRAESPLKAQAAKVHEAGGRNSGRPLERRPGR